MIHKNILTHEIQQAAFCKTWPYIQIFYESNTMIPSEMYCHFNPKCKIITSKQILKSNMNSLYTHPIQSWHTHKMQYLVNQGFFLHTRLLVKSPKKIQEGPIVNSALTWIWTVKLINMITPNTTYKRITKCSLLILLHTYKNTLPLY